MKITKENARYFRHYQKIVEKTTIRRETYLQKLEYLKYKQDKDYIIYKREKLSRLIKMLDDKISFYKDLIAIFKYK